MLGPQPKKNVIFIRKTLLNSADVCVKCVMNSGINSIYENSPICMALPYYDLIIAAIVLSSLRRKMSGEIDVL